MKKLLSVFAFASALPLLAESPLAGGSAPAIDTAAIETAAAQAEQQETAEPEKKPTTIEELEARLDAMNEAFVESRNSLDALSKMKLSGYIQAQYVSDERSVNELNSATSTKNFDQFSIRRGRVKFTYQHSPSARFVLQPDVTSSGVSLKDGYVEFTEQWTSWKHTITAGQFNWPFGFEIMYSSSSREVPERSRVMRTLFPGERDRGVMLSGLGLDEKFRYQVALVNGTGTSQSFDFNARKDLVGRVAYNFGTLDVGASHYNGAELVSLNGRTSGKEFDKTRTGIDFQYATPIPGLGVRGEYIVGEQPPAANSPVATAQSADVRGWYAYLIQNAGVRHQFVVRVDDYDPNTDVDDNATMTINPAYIFHWDANSKVMLSYEKIDSQGNDPDDNVFTLRFQYSF